MKKSRMLLLFGGLLLMLVGYGAWCGRTFYLRSPVPDLDIVPPEARSLALSEIEAVNLRHPEKFTVERFTELLMNPYETGPPPIEIQHTSDGEAWHFGKGLNGLILLRSPSGWLSSGGGKIVE